MTVAVIVRAALTRPPLVRHHFLPANVVEREHSRMLLVLIQNSRAYSVTRARSHQYWEQRHVQRAKQEATVMAAAIQPASSASQANIYRSQVLSRMMRARRVQLASTHLCRELGVHPHVLTAALASILKKLVLLAVNCVRGVPTQIKWGLPRQTRASSVSLENSQACWERHLKTRACHVLKAHIPMLTAAASASSATPAHICRRRAKQVN